MLNELNVMNYGAFVNTCGTTQFYKYYKSGSDPRQPYQKCICRMLRSRLRSDIPGSPELDDCIIYRQSSSFQILESCN